MSKHALIRLTNDRLMPMCQLEFDPIMTLIVWHRLKGDKKVFKTIFEYARKAEESKEGHPCPQCGARLYALAHDPEFKSLAVKERLLTEQEARNILGQKVDT